MIASIFKTVKTFIIQNWELILVICGCIAAVTAWIKNILHAKNLAIQNKKLKEAIDKSDNEIKYVNTIVGFTLSYSDKMKKKIANDEVDISDIIRMLQIEFRNHTIFEKIDYISIPIPLKAGLFVFLTKKEKELIIEDIGSSLVVENWYEKWSRLAFDYKIAYRHIFRQNHLELIKESVFNSTRNQIRELINSFTDYYNSIIPIIDREKATILQDSKNTIEESANLADYHYENFKINTGSNDLGQVAIHFDLIISSIHKIIVDIKPDIK